MGISEAEILNAIKENNFVDTKMSRLVVKEFLEKKQKLGLSENELKDAFKKLKELGHFNKL